MGRLRNHIDRTASDSHSADLADLSPWKGKCMKHIQNANGA